MIIEKELSYKVCLCYELAQRGIAYQCQVDLPVIYRGVHLDCGYRLDIVVADTMILELKSVEHLLPVHEAQLMTYLRLSGKKIGLLINFNVVSLKDGTIRRVL